MNYNKHNVIHSDFYKNTFEIQQNIPKYDILSYLSCNNIRNNNDIRVQNNNDISMQNTNDIRIQTNNDVSMQNNNILQNVLDRQILDFLEIYYNIKLNSKEELSLTIHKWQYEALIYNIMHAQQNSLAYKHKLSHIPCLELLQNMHEIYINSKLCINDITVLIHKLLEKVGFTLSQDLLDNSEHFLAVEHDLISGIISVETSGTSSLSDTIWQSIDLTQIISPKKRIFCSAYDLNSTVNFFFYGMQYLLNESNNKVALLMSGERQGSIGHLLYEAMKLLGISCKVLGFPIDEEKTIDALLEYKPSCIIGIPSHVLSISHNMRAAQLKPSLNSILLSGDSLTKSMRLIISNNFDCEVFAHYGLTESGFGCAVECKAHHGMHLRQLDLFVEIVDEHKKQVTDGEWGEVVITTLTRQAMPLIRYGTGDEGRLINDNCTCGSILKKLEIKGRISQVIALNSEKNIHFMELEEFIYAHIWIINFEICIFSGDKNNSPCLVMGLKLQENAPENSFELISNELELHYNITSLNYNEVTDINNDETGINTEITDINNEVTGINNKINMSTFTEENLCAGQNDECLYSPTIFSIKTQNRSNILGAYAIVAHGQGNEGIVQGNKGIVQCNEKIVQGNEGIVQGNEKIYKNTRCLVCSIDDYLKLSFGYNNEKNNYAELNNIPKIYSPSPKKYIKRINGTILKCGYLK